MRLREARFAQNFSRIRLFPRNRFSTVKWSLQSRQLPLAVVLVANEKKEGTGSTGMSNINTYKKLNKKTSKQHGREISGRRKE